MSDQALYMADIFMPPVPATDTVFIDFILPSAAVLLIITALYFIWRYWTTPQRRLLRQLRQGKITGREAAHALAKTPPGIKNRAQLNQLRFSRRPPSNAEIFACLNDSGHPDAG